jgi:hypothetical protein
MSFGNYHAQSQRTTRLKLAERYRDWVYLTSGFDMSYNPANPDVRPSHVRQRLCKSRLLQGICEDSHWPNKTILVLEVRGPEGKGLINQKGNYQGTLMGLEVHVRDEARFRE